MHKEKKNLLVFGYGLAIILTFIGWRLFAKHGMGPGSVGCFSVAGFMLVVTALYLPVLKVIYKYWMIGATFIGHIVTTVFLSIFFFLVFGTVGIILRILKKDFLDERLSKEAKSYWHERTLVKFDKERCTKQY